MIDKLVAMASCLGKAAVPRSMLPQADQEGWMSTGCYRQGDVMLERIAVLPDGCIEVAPRRRGGRLVHVLAEGERSGHAHQVPAGPGTRLLREQAPQASGPAVCLELAAPARLLHEEHAPIDLPAGTYRVVQQRRYDPRRAAWRRAGD